jgi:hypothetical protein
MANKTKRGLKTDRIPRNKRLSSWILAMQCRRNVDTEKWKNRVLGTINPHDGLK